MASTAASARARPQPKHPSDLETFPLVGFAAWGPKHSWRFARDGQTVHGPMRGPLTTNNGQAPLAAAMAGVGVIERLG